MSKKPSASAKVSPRSDDLNERLLDFTRENPDVTREDLALSRELVVEKKLQFKKEKGGFHAPVPYCIEESRYAALCRDAERVHSALEKVVKGYRTNPKIRAYFPHLDQFSRFLSLPVLADPEVSIARFDLMEEADGRFRVIEPNTCCPGGTYRTSLYFDILKQTRAYRHLEKHAEVVPTPVQDGETIYKYLVSEYEKHFPRPRKYNIVIADSEVQNSVRSVLEHKRDGARRYGHDSEVATIQQFKYEDGKLTLHGKQVHIVYHYLDILYTNELLNIARSFEEIQPFLDALRDRAFLLVNPFTPAFISEDKSSLALLRDPLFRDLFAKDEHAAIEALVPDTYRMREGIVSFEGKSVDLAKLLLARKDDFVIKAQMESMGRDVTIGHQATDAEWAAKVRSSMGGLYIAQRAVRGNPIRMINPAANDHSVADLNYTFALFLFGGKARGMFNRVSPNHVTNVAQGGARQDVVIYRRRRD